MSNPKPNNASVWAFLGEVRTHWITLMSGGFLIVALALYERWSKKEVPTWIYISLIIGFLFWACYLAWRDARKAGRNVDKREFIIERLKEFIREHQALSMARLEGGSNTASALRHFTWDWEFNGRVEWFLKAYFGEALVEPFQKNGVYFLESLLKQVIEGTIDWDSPTLPSKTSAQSQAQKLIE